MMDDPLGLYKKRDDPLGLYSAPVNPAEQARPRPQARSEDEVITDMFHATVGAETSFPGEWGTATKGILKTAPSRIAASLLGFVNLVQDTASGAPPEKQIFRQYRKDAEKYFRDWTSKETPRLGQGSPEYYYFSALSSVIDNVPSLAAGFATGSLALPLFMMGAQKAGWRYGELIEKGYSEDRAAIAAGLSGLAEAAGEKIPLSFLMKNKGLRAILLSSVTEVPTEIATEIMDVGIDIGILNENMSFKDFLSRLGDTAITTMISAPITASVGRGMGNIAGRYQAGKSKQTQTQDVTPAGSAQTEAPVIIDYAIQGDKVVAKIGNKIVGSYDGQNLSIIPELDANRLEIANRLFEEKKAPSTLPVGETLKTDIGKTIDDGTNVEQGARGMAASADLSTSTGVQSYAEFISQVDEPTPTKDVRVALDDRDIDTLSVYAQKFNSAREFAEALGETSGKPSPAWKDLGQKSAFTFWKETKEKGRRNFIKGNISYPALNFLSEISDGQNIINKIKSGADLAYDSRLAEVAQQYTELDQSREYGAEDLQTMIKEELDHFENHKHLPPRTQLFDTGLEGFIDEETGELIGENYLTADTISLESIKDKLQKIYTFEQSRKAEYRENKKTFEANRINAALWSLNKVKATIRERTGQVKSSDVVNEMDALNAGMKKAEQASREAFRIGDKAGALREHSRMKQMEALRREKEKARKELSKGLRWLDALGKNLQKKHVDVDYKNAVESLLSGNVKGIEAFVLNMENQGDTVYLPDESLAILETTNMDNPTLAEVRNMVATAKTLLFQGRAKRLIGEMRERANLNDVIDSMVTEIGETFDLDIQAQALPPTPSDRAKEKGRWRTIKETVEGLHNILVKAEYIFDKAAGFRKDSVVHRNTFQRIVEAENKSITRGFQIGTELRAAFDIIKKNIQSIREDQVITIKGRGLTKEECIMVALNSGNEGNMARLKKGYGWEERDVAAIVNSLDVNEQAFVDQVFNIVNGQGQELADVYRQLTGEKMKMVDGLYFPIIADKELSERAFRNEQEKDLFRQVFQKASVARGMTISRVGGSDAPLLTFDAITKHLKETNHFITHSVAVRDVNRVLNHPAFRTAMIDSVGKPAYDQLVPWLKAVANPYHEALKTWDKVAGRLRSNAGVTILGWSLSTAMLQPSAYVQAINRMGLKNSTAALFDFYRNYNEASETILALSPFMQVRTMTFDADLKAAMEMDTDAMFKDQKMKQSFYALMSWTDKLVSMPTWWAAYHQELKNGEDQAKAVEYADKMVRQTQSSGMTKDMAEIQRGNNTRKLFVMFYSYFSSTYNEMARSVDMVKTGQAGFSDLLKTSWWIVALPALLQVLIKQRDEIEPEDIVKGVVGYGAGMIPIVGSFVNSALGNYEFRPTPAASLATETIKFFHSKNVGQAYKHGAMATGYLFGLPMRQIVLTSEFIMDAAEGDAEPFGLIYSETKKRR